MRIFLLTLTCLALTYGAVSVVADAASLHHFCGYDLLLLALFAGALVVIGTEWNRVTREAQDAQRIARREWAEDERGKL